MGVIYHKYENIRVQNFRVRNFRVKKFSDVSVCPKLKTPKIPEQGILVFLIFGFLEVSENIFTPKISGFTVDSKAHILFSSMHVSTLCCGRSAFN